MWRLGRRWLHSKRVDARLGVGPSFLGTRIRRQRRYSRSKIFHLGDGNDHCLERKGNEHHRLVLVLKGSDVK